jgi:DNA repair protein RadC
VARRTSRRPAKRSSRSLRRNYESEPERLLVSNSKHSACASGFDNWQWLSLDVCAHWRDAPKLAKKRIATSEDVVAICREFGQAHMLYQEFFGVLCLNQAQEPIGFATVSLGGLASAAVDIRTALKPVLLTNSAAFIVTHNHPSGQPSPSQEDIVLTERIAKAAQIMGLRLLDHIIVTDAQSFSFLDSGLMHSLTKKSEW